MRIAPVGLISHPDRLDALLDEHRRALAARRDLEDRGLALTARLGDWQHGADVAVPACSTRPTM